MPTASQRVAVLDGIRCLAITTVVAHHAGFAPGGGIGVTLFFVLSGYLITGLLMRDGALAPRQLLAFYARRFLRLFPALLAVCLFCVVWAVVVLHGDRQHYLLTEVLTSITYVQDFYLGHGTHTADFGYLGHTWSLAIEQQFYLVWPLLLIALLALSRRRAVQVALTLLLAAVVVGWRAHLASLGLNAHVGLALDAQADSLLIGCALALAMPALRDKLQGHQRMLDVTAVFALLWFVAMSLSALNRATPGRTGYLLMSLGTAALIARLVTTPDTPLSRLLAKGFSLKPVTFIGLISYSLYLWHPVLFNIAKNDLGFDSRGEQLIAAPGLLLVILAISTLSYRYIELPVQKWRNRRVPRTAAESVPDRPVPRASGALGLVRDPAG